jgi:hypothetical protein
MKQVPAHATARDWHQAWSTCRASGRATAASSQSVRATPCAGRVLRRVATARDKRRLCALVHDDGTNTKTHKPTGGDVRHRSPDVAPRRCVRAVPLNGGIELPQDGSLQTPHSSGQSAVVRNGTTGSEPCARPPSSRGPCPLTLLLAAAPCLARPSARGHASAEKVACVRAPHAFAA